MKKQQEKKKKKREKGYHYISFTQRLQLEAYLKAKMPIKEIAKLLGIHKNSVYRERDRGMYKKKVRHRNARGRKIDCFVMEYSALVAQRRFEEGQTHKGRPIKLGKDYEFVRYVEKRILVDKLSPLAIIGELRRNGCPFETIVCVNTLYSYIRRGFMGRVRASSLPLQRKKKKSKPVAKRAPRGTSIEQRPEEIGKRNTFGHWEMDCVCGPTTDSLLVLTERLTRYEIIFKIPRQTSANVVTCLDTLEKHFGERFKVIFKSITVDNGSEFSDFDGMRFSCVNKKELRSEIFYCHPYSAYERGTNERINREIRRLCPKGTSFAPYTVYAVARIAAWVNSYPRQVLGFASSAERFNEEFAKIA